MTTKEEVLSLVRKKYSFFKCPTKSDRIDIPEEIWQSIEWTAKEIETNAALPHKMWNRRQDDRPWPLCRQFRGENAIGPRAKELGVMAKFTPATPKLVKGRGITRWMAVGDISILEIPLFEDYEKVWTRDNIPPKVRATERKPGHPNFGISRLVLKEDLLTRYGPSSLQKFSNKSKLLRAPFHFSYHKMLKRREIVGLGKDKTGADRVFFSRAGMRWDSLDSYFIRNAFYAGLAWN